MTCLEMSESFTTLATQRVSVLQEEAGGYGGTVFSLRSRGIVQNISDIKGKIVGVGNVWAPGGFALPRMVSCLQTIYPAFPSTIQRFVAAPFSEGRRYLHRHQAGFPGIF